MVGDLPIKISPREKDAERGWQSRKGTIRPPNAGYRILCFRVDNNFVCSQMVGSRPLLGSDLALTADEKIALAVPIE
jgi:hypothetical protein